MTRKFHLLIATVCLTFAFAAGAVDRNGTYVFGQEAKPTRTEPAAEDAKTGDDATDDKPPLNVFLLAGQSNMAGADSEVAVPPGFQQTNADRKTLFTTAPLPDGEQSKQYVPWGEVRGHESKGKLVHGPEVGFARTLHAAGWRNLAMIKVHANFGRDVQDWPWSERGSLFDAWTSFADARIAELVAKGHTIRVRGFLWHQGIDDAIHGKLARAGFKTCLCRGIRQNSLRFKKSHDFCYRF